METKPETKTDVDINGVIVMDVDEALSESGPCGTFQWTLQLLFMLMVLCVGYYQVNNYFLGNDPSWRCTANATAQFCMKNVDRIITSDSKEFYERCSMNRTDWTYTASKAFSFVTEYDLVCGKTWMAALTSGAFYIGGLFGSLPAGLVADRYGRKLVMIIAQVLIISASVGCSQVASHWQLAGLRVILGGAQMVAYSIGFVNLSEFVAPSYRTVSGIMYQMTFCVSELLIALVAYFEREWRYLQLYASFPCLIPLFLFFFYPQSPRWLLSVGRQPQANKIVAKIAKCNGKPLSCMKLKERNESAENGYTYFHLFKTWKVALLTSQLSFLWTTVALLYFAIALESSNLGGNLYQAFTLTALADFPSYFAAWYVCKHHGRKKSVLGGIIFAGIFIGSVGFVPQNYPSKYLINITLAMIAKFLTNFAFSAIFVWTFELFPTCIRSQGLSYCIAWERVGAFAAPFLISLLQSINYKFPYIILFVTSLVCGLMGLILPETNGLPTRENYNDFFIGEHCTKSEEEEHSNVGYSNDGVEKECTLSKADIV